jgi:hypothetical protein
MTTIEIWLHVISKGSKEFIQCCQAGTAKDLTHSFFFSKK